MRFIDYYRFIFILILGTIHYILVGDTFPDFKTHQISMADGLPSEVITSIVKDDRGFVWLGTPKGLCQWDGFKVIVYKHSDADSNSLIADAIPRNALIWSEFDKQLVAGTNKGISFFDPENKVFTNYYVDPLQANALPSAVNVIYSDRQGNLWIGTDRGFSRFRPESKDFINFYFDQSLPEGIILDRISTNRIHDIRQDLNDDAILWLASLAGVLKFDKYTHEISWFYYPEKDYLRELNQFTILVPHPNGNLYLGTWNFDMLIFNTHTENFSGRFRSTSYKENSLSNRILPYTLSSDKNIWVSSLQGLGIMNPQNGKINFIQSFKNESGHRFAPELFYTDAEGQLWLGSEYGVFILKPEHHQISNYFFDPKDEDHWYLTLSIFEDTLRNELIIGYGRGEGLHSFNMETNRFDVIPYQQRIIKEYNILALLQTHSGEVYFLAADEIYQYLPDEKKIIPLDYPYQNFPAFTDMKQDSKGNIWVASGNLGLQQFNPTNRSVKNIRDWHSSFETGHELPMFGELCIDPENRIWFRRRGESYGYYDPLTDSLRYFSEPGKKYDLTCFSDTPADTIWVATAKNGLGFIDTKNPGQGVKLAISMDSIYTGIIREIAFDNKRRLWCLTEKGLLRLNTEDGTHVLFDENFGISIRDGWSNKNALIPGVLKILSDGRMVIGYRRGLGFFNPDSLQVLYHTPEPYFTSVRVFDKEISPDESPNLKLGYDENYLTFSYSSLDLYNEGITFRHRLLGVDQNWHHNQNLQDAIYPNLQPGSYQFTIQTISESGFGDRKERVFKFRILPPWWKTVWAYVIFLLLISIMLYVFYRFQFQRQLAHREAKRLRELNELKTKLYANITHEFRTPITVIMGLAEDLSDAIDSIDRKQLRKKLETIERSGGNLLHLVNQMLDLAKLEHGKLNYNPSQQNVIPWLQYIVESHQSLAAAKEIQLTFYTETESLAMDFDPDQLMKVVTNLLTNAIKFTGKKGKVICHAKHDPDTNSFHIKVKDTGIGIPENEQSRIFDRFYQVESPARENRSGTGIGLSLTQEIVDMIHGSISVKSQPGKGSEFEVILPVTRNAGTASLDITKFEKPLIQRDNPGLEYEEGESEYNNGQEKPLVLIAEDNPDVAGYIRDTIRLQYKIKWASDGEKALQMAFDLIPDLVITDVMMPGKDGFEVCNTLKLDERTDHIPVVMLTAKVTDSDRISGYERGADAYLTKPFNKKELLIRLEQLLRLRKQLQAKFGKLEVRAGSVKPASPEEQFILKVVQIVEANLEKSMFNAADLSSAVHLSESQLYRKLKAISGKSTAIFIRTVRLKKAKELLETTNLSVSEIGYQVGFNDPAWFSRVFKEEFGFSPTEARSRG
jgi:signal transduction histidine kinase/DNA-binding response OmpR family regulator/streptogramin lyase